jgi:hypothetical protein
MPCRGRPGGQHQRPGDGQPDDHQRRLRLLPYLEPGTYTTTLSTSSYVDRQGTQPATQTVGVAATQISRLQFDYDEAATLSVGLVAPSSAVIPSGIALTVPTAT